MLKEEEEEEEEEEIILIKCYSLTRVKLTALYKHLITKTTLTYISACLLYTSPSPRDHTLSRMPSSA